LNNSCCHPLLKGVAAFFWGSSQAHQSYFSENSGLCPGGFSAVNPLNKTSNNIYISRFGGIKYKHR